MLVCLASFQKVRAINGSLAVLGDGRQAKVPPDLEVRPSDYVEVYANLILNKVDPKVVAEVANARRKGKV